MHTAMATYRRETWQGDLYGRSFLRVESRAGDSTPCTKQQLIGGEEADLVGPWDSDPAVKDLVLTDNGSRAAHTSTPAQGISTIFGELKLSFV